MLYAHAQERKNKQGDEQKIFQGLQILLEKQKPTAIVINGRMRESKEENSEPSLVALNWNVFTNVSGNLDYLTATGLGPWFSGF